MSLAAPRPRPGLDSPVTDPWRPGRTLSLLLAWTALTTLILWLPAIRGLMDGSTYTWGFMGLGGSGTGGDYWFPATASALALVTLWLGWRGGRFPVHLLLVGWHGGLAALILRATLRDPDGFRFQGDTLGVDVNLGWGASALFGAFALLALGWALREFRRDAGTWVPGRVPSGIPPWSPRNTRLVAFALLLLPVQLLLLASGEPHGGTDQVGVLLTLLQWGVLSVAFRPFPMGPARGGRAS
ncbi:MAG: hypothetical protein EA421_14105 [Gemmatimonadales bacterium]|nr:MAG: hypothetical protein EA421_14105 [Gemmatimonadales bacterium]